MYFDARAGRIFFLFTIYSMLGVCVRVGIGDFFLFFLSMGIVNANEHSLWRARAHALAVQNLQ